MFRSTGRAKASRRGPLQWALLWLALALPGAPAAGAGADSVAGEILVQLREGSALSPLLAKHRLTLMARFGQREIYRLKVIGRDKVKDKLEALRLEPAVRSVEENASYKLIDFVKSRSWAIGEADATVGTQWAAQAVHLAPAHRISTGRGVRVAVLDTGVDRHHPALAGKLLPGFDFVDWDHDPAEVAAAGSPAYGHGTHVAGLVAQVAPGARIMPLRVLDAQGQGNAWVLAEAMLHAVDPDGNPHTDDGAHVISLSLSTTGKTELFKKVLKLVSCGDKAKVQSDTPRPIVINPNDDDDLPLTLSEKARCSGFGGAVVVIAAGNHGSDKIHAYPAAEVSESLISVGASTRQGWLARFSNHGWVKLAAPGAEIVSAVPGGGFASWSGTSMAAPFVAGAAALLRSREPGLKSERVVKRLEETGSKLCGTGMRQLDVLASLTRQRVNDRPDCGRRPD